MYIYIYEQTLCLYYYTLNDGTKGATHHMLLNPNIGHNTETR